MERTYAPLIRQFSSIKGYQAAYTLVYALDASEGGCHLTLDRKGERAGQRVCSAASGGRLPAAAISV